MKLFSRLALLASSSALLSLAGSLSGVLADSECYDRAESNTKQGTHPATVDTNRMLRVCSPTAKTKSFTLVLPDGTRYNFDAAGNQKAHELVLAERSDQYKVNATGEVTENTLQLDTISIVK